MTFLNETQRFQLGTLLKGAAIVHGFEDVPEWWGSESTSSTNALERFKLDYGEFYLTDLFRLGMGSALTPKQQSAYLFRSLLLQKVATELQKAFSEAGIKFCFVKGIAQDAKYWTQNPLRGFADLDVWVSSQDHEQAKKIIFELGFSATHPDKTPKNRSLNFNEEYTREQNGHQQMIDLHATPFDGFRPPRTWDNVWDRIVTKETAAGSRNLLPPEDEIIFWAGNQLKSLFENWPKASLDLFVILNMEVMSWGDLLRKSEEARLQWPVWALLKTIESTDVEVPAHVMTSLQPPTWAIKKMQKFISSPRLRFKADALRNPVFRVFWVLLLSHDVKAATTYIFSWVPRRFWQKLTALTIGFVSQ